MSSTKEYTEYIENNLIPNCPITKVDILNANDNFGTNIASQKGKTTRNKLEHVVAITED